MAEIVHIYNKKLKKVDSIYVPSLQAFKEEPVKFFESWKRDYIATKTEFQNPVMDGEVLREATREELVAQGIEIQLEDGEKVENKKIIKIKKPSQYHTWNGSEWEVNIEKVKLKKREELKKKRSEKINGDINMFGGTFQVRNVEDVENFRDVERALKNGKRKATDKRYWIMTDNTYKEFTYEQLSKILDAKAERKELVYNDFGKVDLQLQACKTVEEIEEIEWK